MTMYVWKELQENHAHKNITRYVDKNNVHSVNVNYN